MLSPEEILVKRWVREEHKAIVAEKQAACQHLVSGTYQPDNLDILICDQCGKIITMDDYSENGAQRVAHPRV